jgi:hypothetical protein
MAILDSKLYFGAIDLANGAALASITSGLEGDIVDVGVAGKDGWGATLLDDIFAGNDIFWNVEVTTVVGGAAGFIALCNDETHDSTDIDAAAIVSYIDLASGLAVGQHLSQGVAAGQIGARYLQCAVGVAATTGIVESWLSDSPADTEITKK